VIANTTVDPQDHLDEISGQLQSLQSQNARDTIEDTINRRRVQEEMESTRQCLEICALVSERLDQVRPLVVEQRLVESNTLDMDVYTADIATNSKMFTAYLLDGLRTSTDTAVLDLKGRMSFRLRVRPARRPIRSISWRRWELYSVVSRSAPRHRRKQTKLGQI